MFVAIFVELFDACTYEKVIDWGACNSSVEGKVEGTIDFIHAVLDPVSLITTLTPSVTRLGSGLKGCMLSDTWNYQICKYLAPYSSTSCQRTGDYSSNSVFVCLFVICLTTLSVIRVILCRVVGLVVSEVLAKKPLWPGPSNQFLYSSGTVEGKIRNPWQKARYAGRFSRTGHVQNTSNHNCYVIKLTVMVRKRTGFCCSDIST